MSKSKMKIDKRGTIYSGFVLAFEPKRTEVIAEYLAAGYEVTESFSAIDWKLGDKEIAFLVLDHDPVSVSGAVLLERMRSSGGTKKLMMKVTRSVLWESMTEFDMDLWFRQLISTPDNVKRIPGLEWKKLLSIVRAKRPESFPLLEALFAERLTTVQIVGDSQRSLRLTEQRDALGLSLDIALLNRAEVLSTVEPARASQANSILDLLDTLPVQERSLVEHDAQVFPVLLQRRMKTAQFVAPEGDRQLRIYVADKTKLETKLGIDLLIYQSQFNSFLLLQYKAMEYQPYPKGWSYSVDQGLRDQLNTINQIRARLRKNDKPAKGIWNMRLNHEAFYVKFCERMRPKARGNELAGGITMSVPHLAEFLNAPEAYTEKGAQRVGYQNCPRYLTNTDFTGLAKGGWIGTTPLGSRLIGKLIKELEKNGRSPMLAVVDIKKNGSTPSRRRRIRHLQRR
jgi:hypothetical protein